jgi:N-acetyl sugar amidotransferase
METLTAKNSNKKYQRCAGGVWDTTVPGITFDQEGVSNYYKIIENLMKAYPGGDRGRKDWEAIVDKIKEKGRKKPYDCIVGVSGGTDSSFLLHLAKDYGLRPLAVTLDNGWSSEISVKNIKKVTSKLNIDLETYVIDYEEIKDILKSYMKASLPWIDVPTDIAIRAALYRTANKLGIRYILIGNNFRSEGKQPTEWTYSDGKQLQYIQEKFGTVSLKTFPNLKIVNLVYYSFIKGIKMLRPYYYIDYSKKSAQELLQKEYDWKYYGGHHHENIFTKFAISYWLKKKFNIDKRIITLSAQILSGEISRDEAVIELKKPPYDPAAMERDKDYVVKKLGLTGEEFERIWKGPNKTFLSYPSYYPTLIKFLKIIKSLFKHLIPVRPMIFFELDERMKKTCSEDIVC